MLFLLHADPTIVASAATLAAFATPPVGGYRAPDAPFLNRPLPSRSNRAHGDRRVQSRGGARCAARGARLGDVAALAAGAAQELAVGFTYARAFFRHGRAGARVVLPQPCATVSIRSVRGRVAPQAGRSRREESRADPAAAARTT